MSLILRMSRLFVAMTLLTGPSGPVFAGLAKTTASPDGTAVQLGGDKKTAQSVQAGSSRLKVPIYFEANRGQTDASVKFFTRAAGYNLYLTASEAVMVLPMAVAAKTKGSVVVRMRLKGANAAASVRGRDILPGHTHYLLGSDPSKWRSGVEQYAKVEFSQVYPGIDMVYYGKQNHVEHDFVVAPGANPGRILIAFEGAKGLRLDSWGNLILSIEGGELTYQAPTLYQRRGGKRVPVAGRFVLAGAKQVRFEVGDYIRNQELVIDPALVYSSFLGGTVEDRANAIAVDASGNAYLTGFTASNGFPGAGSGFQTGNTGGAFDVFVTKINPAGTAVVWSTYYGGAGDDEGRGIAVDGTGKVYITGSTTGALPATTPAPTAIGGGGGTQAFAAAIKADGSALIYAHSIGGAGVEIGRGITVDSAGNAYVTGETDSAAPDFVVTALPAQPANGGGGMSDAFVMKFSAAGVLAYSTFLGGTGIDRGNAIAIDSLGNAYITGQTSANLPVVPVAPPAKEAFSLTVTGSNDAFIAKLNPQGSAWLYVTYVGGSDQDEGTGIALGGTNIVYITGWTFSADFPGKSFVTTGQTTIGTAPDGFVFKLHIDNGGGINDGVYATYLGGSGDDRATGVAVDSGGNAYVTGITFSGDFPSVGPISGGGTLIGAPEAFVSQIGPTGGTVGFSTYLGGTTMSGGQGIALDSASNIYVTGWTDSTAATFPTATPFQAANTGTFDAFITKIGTLPPPPAGCTISGIIPNTGFALGGTTVTITGTGFSAFLFPGVSFGGVAASTYTVNAAATVITAIAPRHPLGIGPLVPGPVPLRVATPAGSCSATYNYSAAPVAANGACAADYFYPSPATGATGTFAYCMDFAGTMRVRIYNEVGDLVAKVEDATSAGPQTAQLNTARLAPGVYLYRMEKNYGGGKSVSSGVKKFTVRH